MSTTSSKQQTTETQGEPIKCKKFILKPNTPKSVLQKIQSRSTFETITSNNWQRASMAEICPYILEWLHHEICQFYANRYKALYLEIQDIKFSNLKYMNTWGNNIESIQCICRIEWPNLQQICLWDNKIINIRPFRRIFAPKLTWLDLKTNHILDHDSLSQFYCPSKKLTRLHVTLVGSSSSLVKLEAYDFRDMEIRSYLQIENQKQRKDKLNQRFQNNPIPPIQPVNSSDSSSS